MLCISPALSVSERSQAYVAIRIAKLHECLTFDMSWISSITAIVLRQVDRDDDFAVGAAALNLRNNGSIFGINALSLSGIAQAPLAVTAHLAAEVIQFGIEPRQQFAGARRLDHIDRAINCFLRQARDQIRP